MVQTPLPITKPDVVIPGPTFVHLLARLTGTDVPFSGQSLPDRLSQWFDWTQALALSTALDGKPDTEAAGVTGFDESVDSECTRVRSALVHAISSEPVLGSSGQASAAETEVDYADFRQRYLAMQRSMQAATGKLRGRLREMLAKISPGMARLAEMDAVMELALSPREQAALAGVSTLLGEHFERQRQAGQTAAAHGAWLNVFRKDMRNLLLAELDVRFQPVEGLLAALRSNSLGSHVQKSC